MKTIKESIKEYLNSWIECYYCNEMCKVSQITSDNEDNPTCRECSSDPYVTGYMKREA